MTSGEIVPKQGGTALAQHSLEHYVASRYLHDLNNNGYQATCQNADEMIEDALKIMASLNQATQFMKQSQHQNRQAYI